MPRRGQEHGVKAFEGFQQKKRDVHRLTRPRKQQLSGRSLSSLARPALERHVSGFKVEVMHLPLRDIATLEERRKSAGAG